MFHAGSKSSEKFEYIDFEPTVSLKTRAKESFSRIFGESPSDSSTRAFLRKTRDGFQGVMQIRSAVGTFVADVIGEDPIEVVESVSRKIRSQLVSWKRDRTLAIDTRS